MQWIDWPGFTSRFWSSQNEFVGLIVGQTKIFTILPWCNVVMKSIILGHHARIISSVRHCSKTIKHCLFSITSSLQIHFITHYQDPANYLQNKLSSEFSLVFWPASYKDTHYSNISVVYHKQPYKRQSNSSQATQLASSDQENLSSPWTHPQTSNCQVSTAVLH